MDLDYLKAIALAATYRSGTYIRQRLNRVHKITHKGEIDLVTEVDFESEKRIIEVIRAHFPDHAILSEEGGASGGASDYQWIIDPLDGTTNFAHGLPTCCVSIALAKAHRPLIGMIWCPFTDEFFSAVRGQGAFLNGRRLSVSAVGQVRDSLLVTGFPYNVKAILDTVMQRFARCLASSQGVRRLGSAALDLSYVAAGRFDAFWEQNLHPWDVAAGHLIVTEAGGCVTDFDNQPFEPEMTSILASNGRIHNEMINLLTLKETA
jgi:myo-inositol-1(or 4)-monophosphatase